MLHEREDAVLRFVARPRPVRLEGTIQQYAWGGYEYLAGLTGVVPDGRPRAELWAGAHPGAPSTVVIDRVRVPLTDLIARAPEAVLGAATLARFGPELPYLLKVLDVRAMLSIQAHPTRQQAREGFAREDAAQVPRNAPNRNYRDPNHKPEAQVALTEFWLLYGFRPIDDIRDLLDARPELSALRSAVRETADAADALQHLYTFVMRLPQAEVDALVDPLVRRLSTDDRHTPLEPSSPDYWVVRAAREFPLADGHRDRGILSIYLLNLVRLSPGDATFIGPGVLHAYLSGIAVEIMASSDNVLRGGLTPKHVDVTELLRILQFRSVRPQVSGGVRAAGGERRYPVPATEFELARIDLEPAADAQRTPRSAETLVVIDGDAELRGGEEHLALPRGSIVLAPCGVPYSLRSPGGARVFRAGVPLP
jgi:mannose-6-phosphate isomerase